MRRRDLLKFTAGTTAMASVPIALTAFGPTLFGDADQGDHNETYRGRDIRITRIEGEDAAFIDGRRLHLMKFADDAYLSSMCHYRMAPTPLDAARTAVDELRGANLLPVGHDNHS